MDNIKFISIDETNIQNCHILNESNVPEVGTRALNEFDDLVRNSNFNQCVILNEEVIGFIICFQDTSKLNHLCTTSNIKILTSFEIV